MVQDDHADDLGIIEESDECSEPSKRHPPNRKRFQKEIQYLNDQIRVFHDKVEPLIDHNDDIGSISSTKQRKEEKRRERDEAYTALSDIKKQIVGVRTQLDKLKQEIVMLERGCRIRSIDKLDVYLKQHQDQYAKSRSGNVKEERLLVTEIDSLKRNRAKLEKLIELRREKEILDSRKMELKKKHDAAYQVLFDLKRQYSQINQELYHLFGDLKSYRTSISHLYDKKRQLVDDYAKERQLYGDWMRENKKAILTGSNSYPATFPGRTRQSSVCVDDEELEPFFEQKRDCHRLLTYLEKLCRQIPNCERSYTEKSGETDLSTEQSDEDSAEEFPASMARLHLNQNRRPEIDELPAIRNQNPRTSALKKNKATQPISHGLEVYNLFGSIEVSVPALYQDVPVVLEEVREKLKFFEQQTNILDWNIDLSAYDAAPLSRTVSELTTDSCLESESVCSSYRLRGSDESPLPRVNSMTDEGMSSHESHPDVPPATLVMNIAEDEPTLIPPENF